MNEMAHGNQGFADYGVELGQVDWGQPARVPSANAGSASDGFTWHFSRMDRPPVDASSRIAESTPDNDQLLRLARDPRHQPAEEWFNDETDPFTPDED